MKYTEQEKKLAMECIYVIQSSIGNLPHTESDNRSKKHVDDIMEKFGITMTEYITFLRKKIMDKMIVEFMLMVDEDVLNEVRGRLINGNS